jgi:hypothetical protein
VASHDSQLKEERRDKRNNHSEGEQHRNKERNWQQTNRGQKPNTNQRHADLGHFQNGISVSIVVVKDGHDIASRQSGSCFLHGFLFGIECVIATDFFCVFDSKLRSLEGSKDVGKGIVFFFLFFCSG